MKIQNKENIRRDKQIIFLLSTITEAFPQYSLSQHILHILRKKSESKEAYFWDSEKLLNKTESYYDELIKELILYNNTEEED